MFDNFTETNDCNKETIVKTSIELVQDGAFPAIINRLYQHGKLSKDDRLRLLLAFDEAVTNSLEHGNLDLQSELKEQFNEEGEDLYHVTKRERLQDPHYRDKLVKIECISNDRRLMIKILDEGKGFTPKSYKINGNSENLSCYGRGLALIVGNVDKVIFNKQGTQITLVKNLS